MVKGLYWQRNRLVRSKVSTNASIIGIPNIEYITPISAHVGFVVILPEDKIVS